VIHARRRDAVATATIILLTVNRTFGSLLIGPPRLKA
jgi:hypothetical protein